MDKMLTCEYCQRKGHPIAGGGFLCVEVGTRQSDIHGHCEYQKPIVDINITLDLDSKAADLFDSTEQGELF